MKCGTLLIIDPSTLSLEKMSPHSPTLRNASKICKEWRYSASLTSDGDITTSESVKLINGKQHLKHAEGSSSQK
jgi:hypothetical protein